MIDTSNFNLYSSFSTLIDFEVERIPKLFGKQFFVGKPKWASTSTRWRCHTKAHPLCEEIPSADDRHRVSSTGAARARAVGFAKTANNGRVVARSGWG